MSQLCITHDFKCKDNLKSKVIYESSENREMVVISTYLKQTSSNSYDSDGNSTKSTFEFIWVIIFVNWKCCYGKLLQKIFSLSKGRNNYSIKDVIINNSRSSVNTNKITILNKLTYILTLLLCCIFLYIVRWRRSRILPSRHMASN